MTDKNGYFITHDLGFAAYLKLKGFELESASRSQKGLFNFNFVDSNDVASALRVEYINSDFAKFDAELKSLKKLVPLS